MCRIAFRMRLFRHQKRKKIHNAHRNTTTGIIPRPIFVPRVIPVLNGPDEGTSDTNAGGIKEGGTEESVCMVVEIEGGTDVSICIVVEKEGGLVACLTGSITRVPVGKLAAGNCVSSACAPAWSGCKIGLMLGNWPIDVGRRR